jgi:hypothetical protein
LNEEEKHELLNGLDVRRKSRLEFIWKIVQVEASLYSGEARLSFILSTAAVASYS